MLGRIPQSVLIEGRDTAFRDNTADYLGAAMLCTGKEKPCGVCRDCKKVFAGIHPDVAEVNTGEKQKYIKVDAIRQIRTDAYIKPNEGECRVFLIKNADCMNEEAQNALLKILEEPPPSVGLILTASSKTRLLSTVRSRLICVSVDGETVRQVSLKEENSPILLSAVCEKSAYGILKALHSITADRTAASLVFDELRAVFTEGMACKKGVERAYDDFAKKAASALTAEQLLRLTKWCDEAGNRMKANANKVLSAISLSAEINQILGI